MRQRTLTVTAMITLALVGVACDRSDSSESTKAEPAVTTKPEIPAEQPQEWIVVGETDYIPVVDELTVRMSEARKAFVKKDEKAAGRDLRAAADLMDKEAAGASRASKQQVVAAAKSLRDLAASLDGGKAASMKVFDDAIAKAHRSDLDRDWLVVDATTWYPYVAEPNAHFQAAHEEFLKKDYEAAAEEIRKGEAYVRIESGIAVASAKQALGASEQDLERLAKDVEKGAASQVKNLDDAFARANQALASSHQIKASESWAKNDAAKAEYELKASAKYLENATTWAGAEVTTTRAAAIRDARMLAAKLAAGSGYAVEEVGKSIDSLGTAIKELGQKLQPAK